MACEGGIFKENEKLKSLSSLQYTFLNLRAALVGFCKLIANDFFYKQ